MKFPHKLLMGVLLVMLNSVSFQVASAYEKTKEWWQHYGEQEDAIYAHMKRYGISRDDMAAMRRLRETAPPYSQPHVKILAKNLLNPGEHYRIEMDEYILTMKVPDAKPSASWIWPYTNTRNPDPEMERVLKQAKGMLDVANLGWRVNNSIFPLIFSGDYNVMGVGMSYLVLNPKDADNISTPEKMRQWSTELQKRQVTPQAKIDKNNREGFLDIRQGSQIFLKPEPVIINGRIWIVDAMDEGLKRSYAYITYLHPNRRLVISAGLPTYDYKAHPDPSTYPDWIKKSLAQMDEMIASLRITKINDDGSPDPFVIERVESAPLPVREKLPTTE